MKNSEKKILYENWEDKNKYFLRRKRKTGLDKEPVLRFLMLVFLSGTIYNWSYENVHERIESLRS